MIQPFIEAIREMIQGFSLTQANSIGMVGSQGLSRGE